MNFANFNQQRKDNASMMTKGIISGIDDDNDNLDPVTIMFFSEDNMGRIQKMIRKEIALRTKGEYVLKVDQEEADLLVVMRAILLDMNGSVFQPNKIKHQVKKLNSKTVEYVVPDMIESIKGHYGYLAEISQPRQMPIMQPMNVNNKGRKTLPSITTIWGKN
ncbi:MAG: hypothetical protein Harvfovirus7_17 [Harvfovirus sp.]|uniref:Minor capsid protein P8 central region domain-containing protein n=1 Tax=Harvfovirus sp. TaxID=2487768 RepID=A0A3G5A105_9VIRU|nr:MAG: hypothetical protein Harvfovirus7_17 [Harvfovirus sp.]